MICDQARQKCPETGLVTTFWTLQEQVDEAIIDKECYNDLGAR
ncbi:MULTISPECIES: hypothetical protein [Clostridia]|uniref:Uncharacterized protein n=1 Tax=Lacrimispora xylanolytica TaxID=29375 RepID=A0ABY7AHD2_9FIRM|nr:MULTISPECIES: hypothetical protein [Clostridia]WAJ24868.1 hypothetical protein OW255_04995 [Lacrimispora xylanolytica]